MSLFEGAPKGAKEFAEMLAAAVGRLGQRGVVAGPNECAAVAGCSTMRWRVSVLPWLEQRGLVEAIPAFNAAGRTLYRPTDLALLRAIECNDEPAVIGRLLDELRRRGPGRQEYDA
jgi:hypothetical protein